MRVRDRNASAWLLPNDGTRSPHALRRDMRRFDDADEVSIVVVGCGAGGGVLAQRLAKAGWRVVAMDAGPFWDPDADWVSDEVGSHQLHWTEPRIIEDDDPVPLGANNSGRGVGGSTIHYAGYTPRVHPSDFRTLTAEPAPGLVGERHRRPGAGPAQRAGRGASRAAAGRPPSAGSGWRTCVSKACGWGGPASISSSDVTGEAIPVAR